MTIFILRTTLFCVALVLSLFSDKLFKQQYVKIGKIICAIILLYSINFKKQPCPLSADSRL